MTTHLSLSSKAILLGSLMTLSVLLPGCIESTLTDDEYEDPNSAPKEAMGMWWPNVDGVIEIPTISPLTEWSDAHKIDIEFEAEDGKMYPAKLTYKAVDEGLAIAVEIGGLDQAPNSVSWILPDRKLEVYPDITGGKIPASLTIDELVIDESLLITEDILGHMHHNQIAATYDQSSDDFVLESYAKFLFDDTTNVSYSIELEFQDSTWTFEKTSVFEWILPYLFPRTDISVEGIELTQAVQTANMDIPLVEGKTTLARVYVDSGTSSSASVIVSLHFCFLIFCFEELTKTHAAVQDPNRADFNHSANFVLPDHWVTFADSSGPISVHLIATVEEYYPSGNITYLDPDTSNNYAAGAFEFHQTHNLRLAILPIANSGGDTMPGSTMNSYIDYTEAVFPISDLELIFLPTQSVVDTGSDDELVEWMKGADMLYTISTLLFGGDSDDLYDQMHALTRPGAGSSDPRWYGDFDGDGDNEYLPSGVANPGNFGRVSWCGMNAAGPEMCPAHEINHNLGPVNFDGDGDGFDGSPGDLDWGKHLSAWCDDGYMQDQVFENLYGSSPVDLPTDSIVLDLGWNPLHPDSENSYLAQFPANYPEYESYCQVGDEVSTDNEWNIPYATEPNQWVSTYRYLAQFDDFSEWYETGERPNYYTTTTGSSDSSGRQTNTQSSTVRYVRGVIPDDGSRPSLSHSWTIDGILPAFASQHGDNLKDWSIQVVLRDNSGNILDSAKYVQNFEVHHSDKETQDDYFSFFFQDDGLIYEIELLDNQGNIIDSIKSTNSPTTRIQQIQSEYTRDSPATIQWSANTANSQDILYQLEYSWGEGVWLPVGGLTKSTSLDVNFGTLPGGNNESMFRVRTTNGFDTHYSESTKFRIPNQAPILSLETSGALKMIHDHVDSFKQYTFPNDINRSDDLIINAGESFTIEPKVRDDDWTDINLDGCNAVLKRDNEVLWGGNEDWDRATVSVVPTGQRYDHHDDEVSVLQNSKNCPSLSFPNNQLLPSEMTPGNYVFEMTYTDVNGDSDTQTISFTVIENIYLGPIGHDGILCDRGNTYCLLKEYRENLEKAVILTERGDMNLSKSELQYYVELQRAARSEDGSLSDTDLNDLVLFLGISDSRAEEIRSSAIRAQGGGY